MSQRVRQQRKMRRSKLPKRRMLLLISWRHLRLKRNNRKRQRLPQR
jgi:hypothetical protein